MMILVPKTPRRKKESKILMFFRLMFGVIAFSGTIIEKEYS